MILQKYVVSASSIQFSLSYCYLKSSWESFIVFPLQDRSCVQLWKLVTLVQWRHSHTMVSRDLWYFITWPWQRHSGHALITATSCPSERPTHFGDDREFRDRDFLTAKLHARDSQKFRYFYVRIQFEKRLFTGSILHRG